MASACTPTTTGRQGQYCGGEGERLPCLASRRRHGASPRRGRGSVWTKDASMGLQLRRVNKLGESGQVQSLRENRSPDHHRQSEGGIQEGATDRTGANSAAPCCGEQGLVSGNRATQETREGCISRQAARHTRTRALGTAWAIAEPRARTFEEPARYTGRSPARRQLRRGQQKDGATNLQPCRRRHQRARKGESYKP